MLIKLLGVHQRVQELVSWWRSKVLFLMAIYCFLALLLLLLPPETTVNSGGGGGRAG
jgi:hypothetical protein